MALLTINNSSWPTSPTAESRADHGRAHLTEEAVAECVSDDALIHLKSYKYSAVDKSPISHYILRPYVRTAPPPPAARRPFRDARARSGTLEMNMVVLLSNY
ncbi:hypothetical protein NEMBOFW57_003439 [Staphylotrichum longicolle]|uniref:Uncharacterized protein n=1 Tax=Staphylotrichum longicolle TaxID=669026 RepID=A0AAD4HZJ2_9PEZI|nr:hypothetical protein NEMBOFW57_003439 [Staphylotrichum longicolle]